MRSARWVSGVLACSCLLALACGTEDADETTTSVSDAGRDSGVKPVTPDAGFSASDAGTTNPDLGATPDTECVSPTQNTDRAYEPGARGCACREGQDGQGVCISGAALMCEQGEWQAVEDGPCARSLQCDGRLNQVEDCLRYFDTCLQTSNGKFCGMAPRTEECDGEIVESAANCLQDDAYCAELDSGKYCTGTAAASCPVYYVPADEGCPNEPVYWCFQYSLTLACTLGELTSKQCQAAGGQPIYDPGEGSVSGVGCPDEATALGFVVPGGVEGALCCTAAE